MNWLNDWREERLGPWLADKGTRQGGLFIFAGLLVSWVRHGLEHHWHAFASWEDFFLSWFIHTIAVAVLGFGVGVAAIGTHKFFVGTKWNENTDEFLFYFLITVVVAALAIAMIALHGPSDDYDDDALLFEQSKSTQIAVTDNIYRFV